MSAAVIHRLEAQSQNDLSSRAERANGARSRGILVFPDRSAHADAVDDPDPVLSLYRPRTLALLRRYLQLSSAVGRLPSLIARECFRARVTSYRMTTFEDAVIFVLDMERSLDRLAEHDQQVLLRVVLQGHSHDAAARILQCTRKTLTRRLCLALDHLSERLLSHGLLREL